MAHEAPDCKIVILTTFGRPGYLRRAMDSGASGFLVKDGPVEALADAIPGAGRRAGDPEDLRAQQIRGGPGRHRQRLVVTSSHGNVTIG
jgi:two-component system response regulator DesR